MRQNLITALLIAMAVSINTSAKDSSPIFPAGEKALKQYFIDNLPETPDKKNATKITLMLKIDAEGNVTQALPQGVDTRMGADAVKVAMTLPKFTPGTVDGKAAPTWLKVVVPLNGTKTVPKLRYVNDDYSQLTEILIVDDEVFEATVTAHIETSIAAETALPAVDDTAISPQPALKGKIYRASEVSNEPQFPGGERALTQFIEQHVTYPANTENQPITGSVLVKTVITTDGDILNPSIVRGISSDFDSEALKVVKQLPRFKPALRDGKAVNCQRLITVYFTPAS